MSKLLNIMLISGTTFICGYFRVDFLLFFIISAIEIQIFNHESELILFSYGILIMISYFYYGIQEEEHRIREFEKREKKEKEQVEIQYKNRKEREKTEQQKRIKLNNVLVPLFRKHGFTVRYPLGKWNREYVEVVLDGTRDGYSTNICKWYENLSPRYECGMNKLWYVKKTLKRGM